jgi:hypothetical protein
MTSIGETCSMTAAGTSISAAASVHRTPRLSPLLRATQIASPRNPSPSATYSTELKTPRSKSAYRTAAQMTANTNGQTSGNHSRRGRERVMDAFESASAALSGDSVTFRRTWPWVKTDAKPLVVTTILEPFLSPGNRLQTPAGCHDEQVKLQPEVAPAASEPAVSA